MKNIGQRNGSIKEYKKPVFYKERYRTELRKRSSELIEVPLKEVMSSITEAVKKQSTVRARRKYESSLFVERNNR